jgi:IS30 family transposase
MINRIWGILLHPVHITHMRQLNRPPRKTQGYLTPHEVLVEGKHIRV